MTKMNGWTRERGLVVPERVHSGRRGTVTGCRSRKQKEHTFNFKHKKERVNRKWTETDQSLPPVRLPILPPAREFSS